jgi:hypothetical protein
MGNRHSMNTGNIPWMCRNPSLRTANRNRSCNTDKRIRRNNSSCHPRNSYRNCVCRRNTASRYIGERRSGCHCNGFRRSIGWCSREGSCFDDGVSPVSFAERTVLTSTPKISLLACPLLATPSTRLQPSNLRRLDLWFSYFPFCSDFPLRFVAAPYRGCVARSPQKRSLQAMKNDSEPTELLLVTARLLPLSSRDR